MPTASGHLSDASLRGNSHSDGGFRQLSDVVRFLFELTWEIGIGQSLKKFQLYLLAGEWWKNREICVNKAAPLLWALILQSLLHCMKLISSHDWKNPDWTYIRFLIIMYYCEVTASNIAKFSPRNAVNQRGAPILLTLTRITLSYHQHFNSF